MAPKRNPPKRSRTKSQTPQSDPTGIFSGMVVFLVEAGVQPRRLQIWKQRFEQLGAVIEDGKLTKRVTHVFATRWDEIERVAGRLPLAAFKGVGFCFHWTLLLWVVFILKVLVYQWLEDSLSSGEKVEEDLYILKSSSEAPGESPAEKNRNSPECHEAPSSKRLRSSSPEVVEDSLVRGQDNKTSTSPKGSSDLSGSESNHEGNADAFDSSDKSVKFWSSFHCSTQLPSGEQLYHPPDLNKNVTGIFKKLIDIYRALGDERRSFSYYKAIPVIEKLPFKIESVDQVKHLPAIGKSLQDHIQEIVTTGKLSKLEHFKKDEKVHAISEFGEVWGIGPATALKLYEKGHRTLKDLENEESLTKSQRLGLKYFDDIKTRIPRHEVEVMEKLLQKVGEEVLPGVEIVCGGSYRRGKSSCGDMDIVITHPDGQSHKGFLAKFVKRLKELNFLREDLVFSTHSDKGTDSGVDTYFGLCTYPGRELRHRIDLKVYPRDIYAFGLIAWTGNDTLNRRLRLLAESKGYRLDDTGLFPATHSSGGKRGVRGTASLHLNTEKEVFDFLRLEDSTLLMVLQLHATPWHYSSRARVGASVQFLKWPLQLRTLPSPSPPLLPLHTLPPPPLASLPLRPLPPPPANHRRPSWSPLSAVAMTRRTLAHICRAAGEYQFPDPIPEFAEAETEKFREYMVDRLSKRMDIFEDQDTLDYPYLRQGINKSRELFMNNIKCDSHNLRTFLHEEYGGAGTLMVEPFAAMASDLEDEDLARGPQVAHITIKWGQENIDKDWNEWTSRNKVR
ncbi:DNA polymerase lambda-like protein [Drosera capensis]